MNIYLISQDENNGYDTFDSAVVATINENTARNMNPMNGKKLTDKDWKYFYSTWCSSPEAVSVELIGIAVEGIEEGVICASFNAG